MEGAEACRVQATGMAAMTTALLCQLSAGDHIVAAKAAFGSCRWLVDHLCPRFGLEATVVDGRDNDAWEKAIRPNRSEEHTSELQSLMRHQYAVFWLKKKTTPHPRRAQ